MTTTQRPAGEAGFTMVLVLGILSICVALSAVAFGSVVDDQPLRKEGRDRKVSYAAAEAGLNFYLARLGQDNEYWAKCTNVPVPNATEPSPVNQRWDGALPDPRKTRRIPGGEAKYTIELLPASGSQCQTSNPGGTMLDPSTGTFRIRATGFAGNEKRSVIATLRRKSFLDYLYFTDFETTDPALYGNQVALAQTLCGNKYRANRTSFCREIQFSAADKVNGPFHTNDDILTCNGSTFGRSPADRIETGTSPGFTKICGSTPPNILGTLQAGVAQLPIPENNDKAAAAAVAPYIFTGTNRIILNGASMTVTRGAVVQTLPLPPNGVISVRQGAGCGATVSQAVQDYSDPIDCANVYVKGVYGRGLTIVSDKDIIVNGDLKRSSGTDALLGLIANDWVRIYHPVTNRVITANGTNASCTNAADALFDVTVDAAVLSLNHSFTVDNYNCGGELGTLTITGAIAQTYRGPVGTNAPTGYTKSYSYDDRMRYRNPPYFLDPVAAAWRVLRVTEQVPAR